MKNNTTLSNSLKDILSNKETLNRDMELLDTVHNRELSEKYYPDRKLTPQTFYSPTDFRKNNPLYPEYPHIFFEDLMEYQMGKHE